MNAPQKPSFAEGTVVSYLSHGEGTVTGRVLEPVAGMMAELYILTLASGVILKVGVAAAHRDFKPVPLTIDTDLLRSILSGKPQKTKVWLQSERKHSAKLSGDIYKLAEVVRDLHPRDQSIGYAPGQIYQSALSLLTQQLKRLLKKSQTEVLELLETWTDLTFKGADVTGEHYVAKQQTRQPPRPATGSTPATDDDHTPRPKRRRAPASTPHSSLPKPVAKQPQVKQRGPERPPAPNRARELTDGKHLDAAPRASDAENEKIMSRLQRSEGKVTELSKTLAATERQLEGQRQEVERLRNDRAGLGIALQEARTLQQQTQTQLQRALRRTVEQDRETETKTGETTELLGSMLSLTFLLLQELERMRVATSAVATEALQAELRAKQRETAKLERQLVKSAAKYKAQRTTIRKLESELRSVPEAVDLPQADKAELEALRKQLAVARRQITARNKRLAAQSAELKKLKAAVRNTLAREQQTQKQVMDRIEMVRMQLFAEIERRIKINE